MRLLLLSFALLFVALIDLSDAGLGGMYWKYNKREAKRVLDRLEDRELSAL